MKIKRFQEALDEKIEISPERIEEIISELTNIVTGLDASIEKLESFSNELSNYGSKSKKSNDQIDDSVINLDISKAKIEEMMLSLDTVINNLKDYNQNGRNYIY